MPSSTDANAAPRANSVIGPNRGANAITSSPNRSAAANSTTMPKIGVEITSPVSALSSTWAWISMPGMARDTGVVLMSWRPTAEVPISTSLPAIMSGATFFSSTLIAGT